MKKKEEGLNSSYRGTITYDCVHKKKKKYYVLMLTHPGRYVAVVSDLHRFGEQFRESPLGKEASIDFSTF